MRALVYEASRSGPESRRCPIRALSPTELSSAWERLGSRRSDWHGWMGHDPDIRLAASPGMSSRGDRRHRESVRRWRPGDRSRCRSYVVAGAAPSARAEPAGLRSPIPARVHALGTFVEYVAIHYADENLVGLPDALDYVTAASLGCRFATSFRAVVHQGELQGRGVDRRPRLRWRRTLGDPDRGRAPGASVVAVDVDEADGGGARRERDFPWSARRRRRAGHPGTHRGGAHVSIDALGHPTTCFNSIQSLRKRGRHVQVGLMLAGHRHPPVPMDAVIAKELDLRRPRDAGARPSRFGWSRAECSSRSAS